MKFIVLLLCVVTVQSYRSSYCKICPNHTLCKYSVGGPTSACRNFDREASLADADIVEIVNRINARRNLVAMGGLKKFPQAANMRKVQWSAELAIFAQRWADQCDPSVRPNKEDECRDLVGIPVGQNVAAVVGPAPGLNVKSFVDMWFMLKLHYAGNVVYYNRSRDDKSNYFTQVIWADTEFVGCGKIKFFNQGINTVVERLVCNFAPKGNNHGKPVYALGFPATQCAKFMSPDLESPGLCKQDHETGTKIVPESLANSLLRILDSSNSSLKQNLEPDPLKPISSNSSNIQDQGNQKTRHVKSYNSNGGIKRDSLHMQNPHLNPLNDIDNFKGNSFTPERGHSRMYHGHLTKIEPIQIFPTTQSFSEQDFRRFDITTTSSPLSIQHNHEYAPNNRRIINSQNDYVPDSHRIINSQNNFALDGRRIITDQNNYAPDGCRHFGVHACTRKPNCKDGIPKPCAINQCTRGQSHSCNSCVKPELCNTCIQSPLPPSADPPSHNLCPCKASCPPIPTTVCPVCANHNCALSEQASFCAKRRAQSDVHDANKSTQYNYYDLFPNIGLRNGDENQQKNFDNSEIQDSLQYKAKESDMNNQVKEIAGNIQKSLQQRQDSHDIFYSSERKRRGFEDQMTFKPFWQMDEYNYKRPSELKSLRYTTLADKRYKKSRKIMTALRLPTESITIKLDDEMHNGPHRDHITEKYLSFEELMHLRKLSTLGLLDYEVRRFGDEALRNKNTVKKVETKPTTKTTAKKTATTTTKKATTAATTTKKTTTKATTAATTVPTFTANTPFIRLKQCSRKITCTWTARMLMTGPDGSPITGVPNAAGEVVYNIEVGSRTPLGYVDGCTRTSTCTRDFMDRNKMPVQTTGDDSSSDVSSSPEDEEYCERRSLNVQRRNLDDIDKRLSIGFQEALTEMTHPTPEISRVTYREIFHDPQYKHSDCICSVDNSRIKRNEIRKQGQVVCKDCNNMIENKITGNRNKGDIYYIRRKMFIASKSGKTRHRCECNGMKSNNNALYWTILLNFSFLWMYCKVCL